MADDIKDIQIKLKQLYISLFLMSSLTIIPLLFTYDAIFAFVNGNTVLGQVASISSATHYDSEGDPATKYTARIIYVVEQLQYSTEINPHVYAAADFINKGTKVTVSYLPETPYQGFVISYLLDNPIASILVPFGSVCLLILIPQILYQRKKLKSH